MRQVNIYTATTFKGLNVQNGIIGYILELVTDTEPITLDSTELLYDMKPNRAELIAVIKALQRMKEKCELVIYIQSLLMWQMLLMLAGQTSGSRIIIKQQKAVMWQTQMNGESWMNCLQDISMNFACKRNIHTETG